MVKLESVNMIQEKMPAGEFKAYLIEKCNGIMQEYGLDGISGILSIIILEKSEIGYLIDKYLEFFDTVTYDNAVWMHTVWAASDGYSEDIYIPYSDEAKAAIEERCL